MSSNENSTENSKSRSKAKLFALIVLGVVVIAGVALAFGMPHLKYSQAQQLFSEGKWDEAEKLFNESGINDSALQASYCKGMVQLDEQNYEEAINTLDEVSKQLPDAKGDYKRACYLYAKESRKGADLETAVSYFKKAGDYKDAKKQKASVLREMEEQDKEDAWDAFVQEATETATYTLQEIQTVVPEAKAICNDAEKTSTFKFTISDPTGQIKEQWSNASAAQAVDTITDAIAGLSADLEQLAADRGFDNASCSVSLVSGGTELFLAINGAEQ